MRINVIISRVVCALRILYLEVSAFCLNFIIRNWDVFDSIRFVNYRDDT